MDDAAGERVLVFGSPPPAGRDLDLLVRPAAEAALAAELRAKGFLERGVSWARFRGCQAEAVDLVPASEWRLEPEALRTLFEEALPLEPYRQLVRPAPHHALLVLARRFVRGRGRLDDRRRRRLDAALREDPGAWERARAAAGAWRSTRALELLRTGTASRAQRLAALREELPPLEALRLAAPSRRALAVVAFSGLDGAGKSSQSAALQETLGRLGFDAEIVWSPLGGHPLQDAVGRPAKWLLRRLGHAGAGGGEPIMSRPGGSPSAAKLAWAAFGGTLNAAGQRLDVARRRGKVVILDRQLLDTVVRMRFLYGDAGGRGLVGAVAPRPDVAFFLDVRPETSLARKEDIWNEVELRRHRELYLEELPRHRVVRLDGERPREELCEEIARAVWLALAG